MSQILTRVVMPGAVDIDAIRAFNAMSTRPTGRLAQVYSRTIGALKQQNNLWGKLDAMWLMWGQDAQASKINIRSPGRFDLFAVNSPVFAPGRGFSGDGTTSYLTTSFIPSAAGKQFVQDSAHVGVWVRALGEASLARSFIAALPTGAGTTQLFQTATQTRFSSRLNDSTTLQNTVQATGHLVRSRTASGVCPSYQNGAVVTNPGTASDGVSGIALYVLARNSNGTPDLFNNAQLTAAHVGGGLSAVDVNNLYNILNASMKAVGAA